MDLFLLIVMYGIGLISAFASGVCTAKLKQLKYIRKEVDDLETTDEQFDGKMFILTRIIKNI